MDYANQLYLAPAAAKELIEFYCEDEPDADAVEKLTKLNLKTLTVVDENAVPNGFVVVEKFTLCESNGDRHSLAYVMPQDDLDLLLYSAKFSAELRRVNGWDEI